MNVRKWMAATGIVAVALWLLIAACRTVPVRPHLRPTPSMPGAFDYDWSYCDRRPFLPKFWRLLLGRPWPGDYTCPDHPRDPYVEDPSL
jgi:hypothetical protein